MPGSKQAWPTVAACWSPRMAAILIGAPNSCASLSPKSAALSSTCGSSERGTWKKSSSSPSQSCVCRLYSRLREALVASVACTRPPVSCHSSQLSMVPKASSPASARRRAPGTWSSSHTILEPEK
jgi:hypothetical protein